MLFNTIEFVIFFVFVVTLISVVKYGKIQHLFLLLASYAFFYFSSSYLISLLIFSTLLDFYLGKKIFNSESLKRKKIFLIFSLGGNLGLLGFFKYVDFTISQINELTDLIGLEPISYLNILLPVGISFYTFQTLSYTIDIYRGKLKPSKTLKEFALFVAFFPQLVAGPILRASHFLPQLREKILDCKARHGIRLITIKSINLKIGITIMTLGFLKKMFFADNIGVMVDEIFSNPLGAESFTIILGSIAFGVQIYCDFSGYSDIAIGAAKIFGFRIPINFNKPYFATSPVDFWRKWHISLSSWLRDYLYIPLGGNKKSQNRTYFNLMIVMLLGGLWHGASWNFVIWGFLHGVYLGIEKFLIQRCPIFQKNQLIQSKLGKIISILLTQYLIFMTWIAFRVEDFNALNYSLYKYVIWDFSFETTLTVVSHNLIPLLLIFTFFILHYISYKTNIQIILSQLKTIYWTLFLIAVMISILFFFDGNSQDFIYFRF